MVKPYLSVVIPTYNEERNIRKGILNKVADYLKKQKYEWEVLVVDDASTDKTLGLAREVTKNMRNFRILAESHKGKGGTVIAGVLAAQGEIILFTDADQSTPLHEIENFLPKFGEGFDVVIGSRSGRSGAPLIRKSMSIGFSLLQAIMLRLPYKDTQTGFKAFKNKAGKEIFGVMKKFFEN